MIFFGNIAQIDNMVETREEIDTLLCPVRKDFLRLFEEKNTGSCEQTTTSAPEKNNERSPKTRKKDRMKKEEKKERVDKGWTDGVMVCAIAQP